MNLEESYRGVTLRSRYDRITETFLGSLEGLSISTNIQAATYEGLVEAFHQAVEARSLAPSAPPSLIVNYQTEREREGTLRAIAEEATLPPDTEDDPYNRRQFLR